MQMCNFGVLLKPICYTMKKIDIFHPLTLSVGLAVHNADWNWQNVTSPFTRIYYVTKGSAKIILPSGEYQLRPNHMYMIPSFTLHSYSCDDHFEHYYIHVYEKLEFESSFMDDYNFPVEVKGESIDLELIKRLSTLNPSMTLPKSDPRSYNNDLMLSEYITRNEQRDITLKLESRGILFQIIAKFLREATPKEDDIDNRIKKTLIMIQQNLNKKISVEDLAKEACLCKGYFTRLFKEKMKTLPTHYILQRKIERAQQMLTVKGMSIRDVAAELGYDDCSHFILMFKRETGITPQEFKISTANTH